jgi:hypothetical protein
MTFGGASSPTTNLGSVEDRVRRAYRKDMTWKPLTEKAQVSPSIAKH